MSTQLFNSMLTAARNNRSLEDIAKDVDGDYWNTGGYCMIVQVTDVDGTMIGLTEEVIIRYKADNFLYPDAVIEEQII